MCNGWDGIDNRGGSDDNAICMFDSACDRRVGDEAVNKSVRVNGPKVKYECASRYGGARVNPRQLKKLESRYERHVRGCKLTEARHTR